MITTPNLALKVWNLTTDPYDSGQLANNWEKVDEHDHSPGKGLQIGPGGIQDGAITQSKIASDVTLPAASIPAGFITSSMFATGAVTSAAIADGSISSIDLATASVTSAKFKPTAGIQIVTPAQTIVADGVTRDINNTTITVTPTVASTLYVVAIFRFTMNSFLDGAGAQMLGWVAVDGSQIGGDASFVAHANNGQTVSASVAQVYTTTLSAAGHVVKLQANIQPTSGTGISDISVVCEDIDTTYWYMVVAN